MVGDLEQLVQTAKRPFYTSPTDNRFPYGFTARRGDRQPPAVMSSSDVGERDSASESLDPASKNTVHRCRTRRDPKFSTGVALCERRSGAQ